MKFILSGLFEDIDNIEMHRKKDVQWPKLLGTGHK